MNPTVCNETHPSVSVIFETWLHVVKSEKSKPCGITQVWKKKYLILLRFHNRPEIRFYSRKPEKSNEKAERISIEDNYQLYRKSSFKGKLLVCHLSIGVKDIYLAPLESHVSDFLWFFLRSLSRFKDDVGETGGHSFVVRPERLKDTQRLGCFNSVCFLHVSRWGLSLSLQLSGNILGQWPLRCIRTYESTGQGRFVFDVGQFSPTGPARLAFKTRIGQDIVIYNILDRMVEDAARKESFILDSSSSDQSMKLLHEKALTEELIGLNKITEISADQSFDQHLKKLAREIYDHLSEHFGGRSYSALNDIQDKNSFYQTHSTPSTVLTSLSTSFQTSPMNKGRKPAPLPLSAVSDNVFLLEEASGSGGSWVIQQVGENETGSPLASTGDDSCGSKNERLRQSPAKMSGGISPSANTNSFILKGSTDATGQKGDTYLPLMKFRNYMDMNKNTEWNGNKKQQQPIQDNNFYLTPATTTTDNPKSSHYSFEGGLQSPTNQDVAYLTPLATHSTEGSNDNSECQERYRDGGANIHDQCTDVYIRSDNETKNECDNYLNVALSNKRKDSKPQNNNSNNDNNGNNDNNDNSSNNITEYNNRDNTNGFKDGRINKSKDIENTSSDKNNNNVTGGKEESRSHYHIGKNEIFSTYQQLGVSKGTCSPSLRDPDPDLDRHVALGNETYLSNSKMFLDSKNIQDTCSQDVCLRDTGKKFKLGPIFPKLFRRAKDTSEARLNKIAESNLSQTASALPQSLETCLEMSQDFGKLLKGVEPNSGTVVFTKQRKSDDGI